LTVVRTQLLHCTVATHICVNSVLFSCCAIRLDFRVLYVLDNFCFCYFLTFTPFNFSVASQCLWTANLFSSAEIFNW
jgi:hypothetical protein